MTIRIAAIGVMLATLCTTGVAQVTTLRGVSCFPEGTYYSQRFETFVEKVNERGEGLIKINYLGGAPKVMATLEVGKNLKDGIVDIIGCTLGFYLNVVPEADALKMIEVPVSELRQNGGMALLDEIHLAKMNAHYLGLVNSHAQFHIYLTKEIDKPDLSGLKIRVSSVYRKLVEALGGTAVTAPPSDVYTMLERGTVDGLGWPSAGIFDFSWEDVIKYRVDPGFYQTEINILVGKDAWLRLTKEQQAILNDVMLELEAEDAKEAEYAAKQKEMQADAGIEVIEFSPDAKAVFLETAYNAAWDDIIEKSPAYGPRLKELFSK
ncbi:TRAP transporter substrate-binding protein DctP [Hoeflea sp. CAU 1731]